MGILPSRATTGPPRTKATMRRPTKAAEAQHTVAAVVQRPTQAATAQLAMMAPLIMAATRISGLAEARVGARSIRPQDKIGRINRARSIRPQDKIGRINRARS